MSDCLEIARRVAQNRKPRSEPEQETQKSREMVLKGRAFELWENALSEHLWLVADETAAARLPKPRGTVYTAAEARRIIALTVVVAEIHEWKRRFDGVVKAIKRSVENTKQKLDCASAHEPSMSREGATA